MKKLALIIPFAAAVATTGCVPMYGAGMHGMPPAYPYRPAVYGPSMPVTPAVLPIGRWDNVMMLPQGAWIDVLTSDGKRTAAAFVTATNTFLRLQSQGGDVDIAADTVVRVDRWYGGPEGPPSVARDAAKGAAVGAGAVGVLGLLAGRVPPARVFAAGAILGGYGNAEGNRALRQSAIIYLAPSASPRRNEN